MSLNRVQVITPEQVSLNFTTAGLGSRATAHILDYLILIIVTTAIFLGVGLLGEVLPINVVPQGMSYGAAIAVLIFFLFPWSYFMLFEYFASGVTPGKKLVGIRVIQDNGQSITFLTSAVRNLIRIIDFLPTFYLIGILMIFFHSRHKRVGDLVAGTLVVYQRKNKRTKQKDHLVQEIKKKLGANPVELDLDQWTTNKIGSREWQLLETYVKRRPSLELSEQIEITLRVAGILFPLLEMETTNRPWGEVENTLLALYLKLKQDWQYEAQ